MRKYILVLLLSTFSFSFAQISGKDTVVAGKTYHFDVSIEIKNDNARFNGKPSTNIKLINTKDDTYFGLKTANTFIIIFDLKNKNTLGFERKDDIEGGNFKFLNGTQSNLKILDEFKIEVKKLAKSQYEITKIRLKDNYIWLKIIINIEKSEFDAANALDINDMVNIDYSAIEMLRNKVNFTPFIITDYRTTYYGNSVGHSNILKTERVDYTFTTPEKTTLKIPKSLTPKELEKLKGKN